MMLPKLDGVSLCQRLRFHGHGIPILMLTARDTTTDKVAGLDGFVKPIELQEYLLGFEPCCRREVLRHLRFFS